MDWQKGGIIASVSRGRRGVFSCEGNQGNPPTWLWIGVGDAEALFKEYKKKRAKIRHPPTNYDWAYEMQVEDPDGNVLRLGSEPKKDEPLRRMARHARLRLDEDAGRAMEAGEALDTLSSRSAVAVHPWTPSRCWGAGLSGPATRGSKHSETATRRFLSEKRATKAPCQETE